MGVCGIFYRHTMFFVPKPKYRMQMHNHQSSMITFDLPTPDKRIELFRLDAEPIMKHVTPGFGLFISRFTDDMLVSYFKNKEIDKYQKNVPSHLRYFYLIRAVWRKVLLDEQRTEWEKRAEDEPHLAQLSDNTSDLFDRILKREIDRKLYERSDAFEDFKSRENLFKDYFMRMYNKNLELPSDSPFERTVNLGINVDYSESITSPHSIQLLKVFLNLEQFVNILIESDKEKAIELIKQTVNYNPHQMEYLLPMLSKLLPKSSPEDLNEISSLIQTSSQPVKTDDKLNYRQLAFYPLLILEKLLCHFSPDRVGEQKAVEFRHDALKLGVMDFVLECISHFTHQRSSFKKIRSWRMPLPQYSVFFTEIAAKRSKSDTLVEQNQADSSKSSESSYKGKVFFAKGTGYGWGDVRQQWDYKENEQKLRYDDDNIACLLNILRAFIMPPIHEQGGLASAPSSGKSSGGNQRRLRSATANTSTASGTKNILRSRNSVPMEEEFLKLLHRSCLRSVIRSYLMSDSLLEVHKNVASYHAVFQLLVALSKSAPIIVDVEELFGNYYDEDLTLLGEQTDDDVDDEPPEFISEKREAGKKQGILPFDIIFCAEQNNGFEVERSALIELLKQFTSNIDNYLKRIGSTIQPSQVQNGYFDLFTFFGFGTGRAGEEKEVTESEEEEQLHELSSICKEVISIFHEQNKSKIGAASGEILKKLKLTNTNECVLSQTAGPSSSASVSLENKYCTAMQQQKFAVIPFEKIFNREAYFYRAKLKKEQTSGTANMASRRIAREIQSLRSNLMLTTSTSAFVRSCEEHLDAMKVLITGPEGTPYQNGCFEFDFFFPTTFPQTPPQVHLRTTGNGTVRFNPNLYNEGKVCLSILGTWHGRPEEQWNAERSSVLQVIISIQSLILVNDPYYNEPGYERYNNTQQGDLASRRYNAGIQVATVRWAILEQLKRPPTEFESVVQLHFWLKRDEITAQIQRWIDEWRSQAKQDSRFASTADELEKLLKQVSDELQKLKKLNLKA